MLNNLAPDFNEQQIQGDIKSPQLVTEPVKQTQIITQQCINCKGKGKTLSIAKILWKFPLFFIVIAGGIYEYDMGLGAAILLSIIAILLTGWTKRCKVCKGKGNVEQTVVIQ